MKILVTVDGSECSSLAIDNIVQRHWGDDDRFMVLTVVEPLPREFGFLREQQPDSKVEAALIAQYQAFADAGAAVLSNKFPNMKVETQVGRGPVAATIVNCASAWGADLIVMASHGRKGFQRILIGSVAEEVLKLAHCSVEVIKQCKH